MDIFYLGHSAFRLKGKSQTVLIDPFDPEMVGIKLAKQEANIVLVSHDHPDHSATADIEGNPKIVQYPGEYEIGGVSIVGFQTFHDDESGAKRGKNIVYLVEIDGVKVLHCGDLGHTLKKGMLDDIGVIDVLLVPVGGEYTIGPKEAVEVIKSITPRIVIPMHYKTDEHKKDTFEKVLPLESFIEESGMSGETMPKLTIKKAEGQGEQEQEKLVILEKSK
jgi:L-ascorbate metabolism protein UlaG (beta-lactamase superfamily)